MTEESGSLKTIDPINHSQWIGMIYHERRKRKRIYSHVIRAILVNHELEKNNYKLFLYTPGNVDKSTKTAAGHYVENGRLQSITLPIPKINYDYHFKSNIGTEKQQKEYRDFEPWAIQQGIEIYPPKAFRQLARDKLSSILLIAKYDKSIAPKTEIFTRKVSQINQYLQEKNCVFIKPRYGRQGDDIFVIKKTNSKYVIEHYYLEEIKSLTIKNLSESILFINKNSKSEEYIIQEAIESLQYEGCVFIIRTNIFTIDKIQFFLSEVTVGKKGRSVSNTFQGGAYFSVQDFLSKIFSQDKIIEMTKKIKSISTDLARFLNSQYQEKINEMAFDLLIDQSENIYISEINAKPGLTGQPFVYSDFHNMTSDEKYVYETVTAKHGEYLAKSLLAQCKIQTTEKLILWFNDLPSRFIVDQTIDQESANALITLIFDALKNNTPSIKSVSEILQRDNSPRILFITISNHLSRGKTYLGSGDGLLQAVNAALALAITGETGFDLKSIKLDIVKNVHVIKNHNVNSTIKFERSLHGLAFDENIRLAYLPEELTSDTIVNNQQSLVPKNILKTPHLSSKQRKAISNAKSYTLYAFTTESFYFSKDFFYPLYRGHRLFPEINGDLLLTSAIAAGEYLEQAVKKNGNFIYEYLPKKEQSSNRYNILRHAGSIYSMLELYEITKNESLLKASELALINLLDRAQMVEINQESLLCIVENGFAKLGANAITLLALTKFSSITQDTSCLEIGRRLAKWMHVTQNYSGEFLVHKQKFSEKRNMKFISQYYPGEAIFSLIRFYQLDPNPLWLETAKKAVDYLVNIRDKNKKISQLEHDHWLLYGLNELYPLCANTLYITHTQKICKAILGAQYRKHEPTDYLGSFYTPPRSTPVATRAEGLCAAYSLLKQGDDETFVQAVLEGLLLCIRFQLQTQFRPERTLYLNNPQTTLGGFSRSFTDYSIRIDYVQHNLSSIIGLYKILKLTEKN